MLVSCSATPRFNAYSAARGPLQPKILMQIRPTADATRRQYSNSSSKVAYAVRSRSIATPSITSSNAARGRSKRVMNG
jgi:hypothetical protein